MCSCVEITNFMVNLSLRPAKLMKPITKCILFKNSCRRSYTVGVNLSSTLYNLT